MTTETISVRVRPLMKQITLHVHVDPIMTLRLRIATLLVRLAAWVAGTGLALDTDPAELPVTWVAYGVPSALSLRAGERGCRHDATALGQTLNIFLDGVSQEGRAVAYDLDAGTVTRAVFDDQGKLRIAGDGIMYETVRGHVEVTRKG